MKNITLAAAVLFAATSFGALRTYWSFTNTVHDLPDLQAGRITFSDGSSFDTNHGVGTPKFYESFVMDELSPFTNVTHYANLVGKPVFFAKGRPIVIEPISGTTARSRISWGRYIPTSTYHYIDVPTNTVVFGGSDGARGTDGNFVSTCITVAGAKIRAIYGGNIGYGVVGNVSINVTGGADVYLIYASNLGFGNFTRETPDSRVNRACVGKAVIELAGNANSRVQYVYGGGFSVSDVGSCEINVRGGRVDNVVPGPASGLAGSLVTTVYGGSVGRLPAWSRGYVGSSVLRVYGGVVDRMYAGGDSTTASEPQPGNIESAYGGSVYLELTGGTVTNLCSGLNAGSVDTSMVKGVYTEGVVQKYNGAAFDPAPLHLEYAIAHSFNNAILFTDAGDGKIYRYVSTNGTLQATCLNPDPPTDD